ncbi:MAG: acyl-CoA dehydrogenase [Proteobacteria bacterium]|nr:acyl-CoA dehydrogenase [Pseudomonadota bacterium]
MATRFVSDRNIRFTLFEVLAADSLTTYPYYKAHSRKTFDMIIDAAMKLSKTLMHPIFEEMDRKPPEMINNEVHVHPHVKKIMREAGEGGWIASIFPYDLDGEQLPWIMAGICSHIFCASNYSASVYPELARGAANLIASFGNEDQKKTYLPNLLNGVWQGTMALTEPEAGSGLADITTMAYPVTDGIYKIKGQKVFISAGDHNGVDNVVHLMLAKIEGAPAGVKGISLFIVPKKRISADGKLVSNDVAVSQIFHKMGYRGCPITQLAIGEKNDCMGYLVGEPNKGLFYMFQMMNESRLGVGLAATSIATAAYYAALEYTKGRRQGRRPDQKDPSTPMIPIIEHSDVKRMLLFQRAVSEGALSLIMQCFKYADLKIADPENGEKYHLLLEILTPIAKTYPSEMACLSVSQSIQCLGGYGYCDDFPVEQHYRDTRIHPIHEGTTGIQGMDILGRKVTMSNGKAFLLFIDEVNETIKKALEKEGLNHLAGELKASLETLEKVTGALVKIAREKGPEVFLSDATLYLEMFSNVTIAWQWLTQAIVADTALGKKCSENDTNFYQGKLHTCRYFFGYELPKNLGLEKRLLDPDTVTVDMQTKYFTD